MDIKIYRFQYTQVYKWGVNQVRIKHFFNKEQVESFIEKLGKDCLNPSTEELLLTDVLDCLNSKIDDISRC